MEPVKINNKNMILGVIVMLACVYVGAISAMPHQTEIITAAVNIPSLLTPVIDIPQQTFTEEQVYVAMKSDVGVINALNILTIFKIIVIVSVAGIVFMLLATTGLIPRFGGES